MTIAPWLTLRDAVTALLVQLAGPELATPSAAAVSESSEAWTMPGPERVKLAWRISSDSALGRPAISARYDGSIAIPGDTYVPPGGGTLGGVIYTASENRVLMLEVKTSAPQEVHAGFLGAKVRLGFRLPSVVQTFRGLGLGLATVGPLHDMSGPDLTGRALSVFVFEAEFNGAFELTDTPVTTIETADWFVCPCGG